MPPCNHPTPRPNCHLCTLFVTRADYNALWCGDGIKPKVRCTPRRG